MAEKKKAAKPRASGKEKSGSTEARNARLGLPDSFSSPEPLSTSFSLGDDPLRESFFKSSTEVEEPKTKVSPFDQIPLLRSRAGVAIVTAILTFAMTLGFTSLFATNPLDTTTLAARISGGVALSESELRDVVKQIGENVYWAGPMSGAKYTINAQNAGAIYVRYLPDGKGISDNSPKYRVIATYKEPNGYDATLAAGNQPDGVSLNRADNSGVIYYNKKTPTNVYVAFRGRPFQIEIFDPSSEEALSIANDSKAVELIK